MSVILTTPDDVETWKTAPPDEALKLQRPLPDGVVRMVARGAKQDPPRLPPGVLHRPAEQVDNRQLPRFGIPALW